MKKILLLIAASVLFFQCTPKTNTTQVNIADKTPVVKVAKAEKRMIDHTVDFVGNIEPSVKNYITSATSQRIEKIFVEVGDKVKKGDLLVTMESVNYVQTKLQLENLLIERNRIEALLKSGGVTQQAYDQIQLQISIAKETLNNLELNTNLTSPIDGVVAARNFDKGDMAPGQPILVIIQLSPVKLFVNISEEYFPLVKVGAPVSVKLDTYENQSFESKIALIHPIIESATKTFQAQVQVSNQNLDIRPGMFARVNVSLGEEERLVVPDYAVIKQRGTNNRYVYILNKDNTVSYTKIKTGKRFDNVYEILEGLKEGDTVVTAGHSNLLDKATVKVDNTSNF